MTRANVSELTQALPQLEAGHFRLPDAAALRPTPSTHAPRIVLLYGSLRPRSFSRLLTEEAARLLQFEHAAFLRDEIEKLQRGEDPTADTSTRRAAEKQRKTGKGRRSYKK